MKRQPSKGALTTTCSVFALCAACTRGEVDLGGGAVRDPYVPEGSRCAESVIVDDTVEVHNQSELDALAGCEEITGGLVIDAFPNADVSPLASLRVIGGNLRIKGPPEPAAGQSGPRAGEDHAKKQHVGGFESLRGFEPLETIGGELSLSSILAEDLTGFASLRGRLAELSIADAANLRDLSGLEGTTVDSLSIFNCNVLESLTGINLSPRAEEVVIRLAVSLKDVDVLAGIDYVGGIDITGTALEALPQIPELFVTGGLTLVANDQLVDASGLDLLSAPVMNIRGNPKLRVLPRLANLGSLDILAVTDNDALEEVSLNLPNLTDQFWVSPERDEYAPTAAKLVDIGRNPALKQISSPASFELIQYVNVYSNPSLTDVDFGTLERVDFLTIDNNPALETVTIPSLDSVDSLTITNNPAFVPSVFDAVPTFTRVISSNASAL